MPKDIVAIGAVLFVSALVAYALTQRDWSSAPPQEQAPLAEKVAEGPTIHKQFEDVLNGFLRSMNTQLQDYKKERRVLSEAVKPENLRSPEYVEENYRLVQELVPDLRRKMDGLMQTFSVVENEIEILLVGETAALRDGVMQEWQDLKDNQAGTYIEFFTIESDVLDSYEALMAFYYQKSPLYEVDVANGRIIFESREDEAQRQDLLQTIAMLSKKQGEALARK